MNRVRLPILLVVSWKGKFNVSLSPFTPKNLVSLDGFGSPGPRQPAHLNTEAECGAYLRDSSRFPRRRPYIYLNRHTPSDQSRVYRVTQLHTDGVRCRESADTGPVVLKVVPVTGAAFASPWTNQYAPVFPTLTIGILLEIVAVPPDGRKHFYRGLIGRGDRSQCALRVLIPR